MSSLMLGRWSARFRQAFFGATPSTRQPAELCAVSPSTMPSKPEPAAGQSCRSGNLINPNLLTRLGRPAARCRFRIRACVLVVEWIGSIFAETAERSGSPTIRRAKPQETRTGSSSRKVANCSASYMRWLHVSSSRTPRWWFRASSISMALPIPLPSEARRWMTPFRRSPGLSPSPVGWAVAAPPRLVRMRAIVTMTCGWRCQRISKPTFSVSRLPSTKPPASFHPSGAGLDPRRRRSPPPGAHRPRVHAPR